MEKPRPWVSALIALPFSMAAFVCVFGGLTVPVPGTQMLMDPRELFVTVGCALTGPLGALLIGIGAGIYDPVAGFPVVSLSMHVVAGLWMALSFRFLTMKLQGVRFFAAWCGSVVLYYLVFLIPTLVLVTSAMPPLFAQVFPGGTIASAFLGMYQGGFPEIVFTALSTTVVLILLPGTVRRPLW